MFVQRIFDINVIHSLFFSAVVFCSNCFVAISVLLMPAEGAKKEFHFTKTKILSVILHFEEIDASTARENENERIENNGEHDDTCKYDNRAPSNFAT